MIKFINELYGEGECDNCHKIIKDDKDLKHKYKMCMKQFKPTKKIRLKTLVSKWHYALDVTGLKDMESQIFKTFQYMTLAVKGI